MTQSTGKSNGELARRYIDAVMCPDERHGLVERHGADRVLRAANTLAVLAVVDAVREGPTPLRDCIAALAPQLRPAIAHRYLVGDPDPTGDDGPFCPSESPDGEWQCTWPPRHVHPQHIAGDGIEGIRAVWS